VRSTTSSLRSNREIFEKAPTKYAPAYGGVLRLRGSIRQSAPGEPLLWSVVDGQLIVQHTKGAVELWEKDVKGNKAKADTNWARLVEIKAGKRTPWIVCSASPCWPMPANQPPPNQPTANIPHTP